MSIMLTFFARLVVVSLVLGVRVTAQKSNPTLRGSNPAGAKDELAFLLSSAMAKKNQDDDDDYPHLIDCLIQSSATSDDDCFGVDGGCLVCTSVTSKVEEVLFDDTFAPDDDTQPAPSSSAKLCVSEKASESIMESGKYHCTGPSPADDDVAPNDDDTTGDDAFAPDLFECLDNPAQTDCQSHVNKDGSNCVWCEEGPSKGICLSSKAAKQIDGYTFHCLFPNASATSLALVE